MTKKDLIIPERLRDISHEDFWKQFGKQGSWYDLTIDSDKVADMIKVLNNTRKISRYLLGRMVVEIKRKIQEEFEAWDIKYYR